MAPRQEEEAVERQNLVEALDRQTSSSSRSSSSLGHRASTRTSRTNSSANRRENAGADTTSPLARSTSSAASSFGLPATGILSPLRKELEQSRSPFRDGTNADVRAGKRELARRLSLLAQQLTYGDSMEELVALDSQVNQIEQVISGGAIPSEYGSPISHKLSRPMSVETPVRKGSRSDLDGGPLFSSPSSSFFRSQYSDLSPALSNILQEESDDEDEEEPPSKKGGMTPAQANKVISEMSKLNDELVNLVTNLKARQEETEHIQNLLIERAERAAQRIIFLQNRITYLEQELQENDAELQHLRVCLKAVEIQLPPHPDRELQRCFTVFKDGYQALKRKRAHRSNMVSFLGYDSSIAAASPTR